MNRVEINSALVNQCLSIPALCSAQIAGVKKGLDAIPDKVLKKCRKIIITGCGDSYVAAKAAIPAFKKFGGQFGNDFVYDRAINVARYMNFDLRYSDSTLVVAVSCSGGPARIKEVLERAKHYGCHTLAVTNNPESPAVKTAEYSLIVGTPHFPDANPGLRNYYASLVGLYLLAAKFGEVNGISSENSFSDLVKAISDYSEAYAPVLEGIANQMFELAKDWKEYKSYDFIGDDIEYCSAFFSAAKMVEVVGSITNVDDAENWCHVSYFQKKPDCIGTMVVADKLSNDRSRIGETVKQAAGIGRPIVLIANGTKEDFGITADIEVCTVPEAPEGFEFLLPMMNYLPGAMLAGYISALKKEPYFRGGGIWANPEAQTIRSSKLEIV